MKQARLALALCKSKAYFLTVDLILLVDVFDKGLEVFGRFFRLFGFGGFGSHDKFLRMFYGYDYITLHERTLEAYK
jgi:hypothetical protein